MRIYIVNILSANWEGDNEETYFFTNYDEAYTAYKDFIAEEMKPGNSWVGTIEFDEEGPPVDTDRYDCTYDDNNSNESDVYWRIDDTNESPCFVCIELNHFDIELEKCTLSTNDLWQLCVDKQWFTNGDSHQYQRMFEANMAGCSLDELVAIIWICSDKSWTREQIKDEILTRQICGRNPQE